MLEGFKRFTNAHLRSACQLFSSQPVTARSFLAPNSGFRLRWTGTIQPGFPDFDVAAGPSRLVPNVDSDIGPGVRRREHTVVQDSYVLAAGNPNSHLSGVGQSVPLDHYVRAAFVPDHNPRPRPTGSPVAETIASHLNRAAWGARRLINTLIRSSALLPPRTSLPVLPTI
jgi:hypothetical protein